MEATLETKGITVFAICSPIGFQNAIFDKSNYHQLRNETFLYANLKSTFIDEYADNSESFLETTDTHIAEFAWPENEFSNFVITPLTKKPNRPRSLIGLISCFRQTLETTLTEQQLKASYKAFYSHIKDTGLFLVKRKSIGIFPKTCCINQFTVKSIES